MRHVAPPIPAKRVAPTFAPFSPDHFAGLRLQLPEFNQVNRSRRIRSLRLSADFFGRVVGWEGSPRHRRTALGCPPQFSIASHRIQHSRFTHSFMRDSIWFLILTLPLLPAATSPALTAGSGILLRILQPHEICCTPYSSAFCPHCWRFILRGQNALWERHFQGAYSSGSHKDTELTRLPLP